VVRLHTKALIKEVMDLVESDMHSQAVIKALSQGQLEREIRGDEVHGVKADLILSGSNVRWDLMK
jgi:hypothetical protein